MNKKSTKLDLTGTTVYSGRQLYDYDMISGLNKKPVNDLISEVTSTVNIKGSDSILDLTPRLPVLLEHILVDGTFIIYNGDFLTGCFEYISDDEALFKDAQDAYTHMVRMNDNVILTRWNKYSPDIDSPNIYDKLFEQIDEPIEIPGNIVIFHNGGHGILYGCQRPLLRMEEIFQTLKITTPLEAILFITNMSESVNKVNARISDKVSVTQPVVPLGAGSVISQPNYSALAARLFKEIDIIRPNYLAATFSFEQFPHETGISRRYQMSRYLSKINELKQQCQAIYALLGSIISFKTSDITEYEEDRKKIEDIYIAIDKEILTISEATPIIRELLGFL
jgi:hypothetical protein